MRLLNLPMFAAVVVGACFAQAVLASVPTLPNFNANFVAAKATQQTVQRQQRLPQPEIISHDARYERISKRLRVDQYDAQLERPTFLWAGDQAGRGFAFWAYKQGQGAQHYAQAYLKQLASRLKISPAAVDNARLVFLHDDGQGAVIARYQQVVDGYDVAGRQLNVVMNQSLDLIAVSGYFASVKNAANQQFNDAFRAGPQLAMNTAFADLGLPVSAYNLYETAQSKRGYTQFAQNPAAQSSKGLHLTAPVNAKRVLFPLHGELVPGWLMVVRAGRTGSQDSVGYLYIADADGEQVLFRKNLVAHAAYTYRVFADDTSKQPDDSPYGNALVPHPTGNPADTLIKTFGAGTLVDIADATHGVADAWLPLPAGGAITPDPTITQGNNAFVYADVAGDDGQDDPLDVYASTTSANTFDYAADFTKQPTDLTNQQAGIVQLFYLVNWLHDAWYDAGFTEATGNAQYSNYGRTPVGQDGTDPLEGDVLLIEAQDSSGRNNANMGTPPDGFGAQSSPVMQMYLWDGTVNTAQVDITAPAGIVQTLDPVTIAAFGDRIFNLSGSVVAYDDGSTADEEGGTTGTTTDACQAAVNATQINGKIALIDRGICNFTDKVKNAQTAGAVGVLMVNNVDGDDVIIMAGDDASITIPAMMVSMDDGQIIKNELTSGSGSASVTMAGDVDNDRDGAFGSQVVAHEFFHYVSNRLIANGAGLDNMQGGGMGEGWGDMAGLLLTARADDLANSPNGAYSSGGFDADDFYEAIRRYPYSTDLAHNPQTFADITTDPEVHNIGEIWAIALWEAYVGLYNHYETVDAGTAFTEAKTRMMNYIIEGLMVTPASPTMIEARDAILAVVQAADATDYDIFVTAFAKRGMGWGAIAPPRASTDMSGVVESFATDLKAFAVQSASVDPNTPTVCDTDFSLDPGETGEITLTVLNTGSADLSGVTAQLSSVDDLTFANGGLVTFTPDPLAMFGGTLTATTTATVNSAIITSEILDIDIAFPQVGATVGEVAEPAAIRLQFVSNQDFAPARNSDDMENSALSLYDWTRTEESDSGLSPGWSLDSQFSADLGLPADNVYWYGPDNGEPSSIALVTPPLVVGAEPLSVTFHHYYQFEEGSWDGGVVEISADGGQNWSDVMLAGGSFANGYNGTIVSTNPTIPNRNAYVNTGGTFGGTPEVLSFGNALAGQTVQLRFRIGTDQFVSELGWIIDEVTVTGALVLPFSGVAAENGVCNDAPPVANAGQSQTVTVDETVTLDGSASTDAEGAVTYLWEQAGGGAVTLSDTASATPSFTAPDTAQILGFKLTVTDSAGQSSVDSISVIVNEPQEPDPPASGGGGGGGGGGSTGLLLLSGLLGLGLLRRRRH